MRGLWEELGKGDFGWEEKEGLMMMTMMKMPLPKVRLGKAEPGEGLMGVGKAWENCGRWEGLRGQLLSHRCQTLQVWAGACSWDVDFSLSFGSSSFSLNLQHSPNVRNRKPAVSTVSPSCCIQSFGFLWKNCNVYPHPRFYCLEKLYVKKDEYLWAAL